MDPVANKPLRRHEQNTLLTRLTVEVPPHHPPSERGLPMIHPSLRTFLCTAVVLLIPTISWAQTVPVARPYQQQNPWNGNTLGQAIYWLANDQMVDELDILPDQKEKLTKLRNDMQTKSSEAYKAINFNELPQEERTTKYYEIMNKLGDETAKEVEKILLPHQIKRLKQIMTQTRLGQLGYGGAATLGGDDIAKELGITDEQREELKKKEEEVRQDMQKKTQEFYKKLQEEAREKLFSVLTPAQRKKLDELTGEKFEWKYQQPAGGQEGAAKPAEPSLPKK
jgi:Spy/CpxP family protein refolding chaperone